MGCPNFVAVAPGFRRDAFTAENLEERLTRLAHLFVNERRDVMRSSTNEVTLSAISD
jgi:hypothetical protein